VTAGLNTAGATTTLVAAAGGGHTVAIAGISAREARFEPVDE